MMKEKIVCFVKLATIYLLIYLITTIGFVGLFHTPILKSLDVFMYRGIVFIIMCAVIAAIIMLIIKKCKYNTLISFKDIGLLFCLCCSINMVLFTMLPVTVERSVSVFMLSYMYENEDEPLTEEEMSEIFVEKYVNEYQAFDKRFNEQIVSGNIEKTDDGYVITSTGKKIVDMFRTMAEWFDTDRRIVYPNEN